MSISYGGYPLPPAPAPRRRSIAPWWVSLIILGTGGILAFAWLILGGLPFSNHAAYGSVPVPGSATLQLPAGKVMLSFEEDGLIGEDDSADMPADLAVSITGADGPVAIERLSHMLFSVQTNKTGHVPYGQMDLAAAGDYSVATAGSPTSAVAPRVTFGEPLLNPFGPAWMGALIIFAPFAILALILILPLRRG